MYYISYVFKPIKLIHTLLIVAKYMKIEKGPFKKVARLRALLFFVLKRGGVPPLKQKSLNQTNFMLTKSSKNILKKVLLKYE